MKLIGDDEDDDGGEFKIVNLIQKLLFEDRFATFSSSPLFVCSHQSKLKLLDWSILTSTQDLYIFSLD